MASSTQQKKGRLSGGGVVGAIVPPKKKVDKFPLMSYLAQNCTFEDVDNESPPESEESIKAANNRRVEDMLNQAKISAQNQTKETTPIDDDERRKALEVIHSLEYARNQKDTWKVVIPDKTNVPDYGGFLHPLKRVDKEDEYFSGTRKAKQPRERKRSRSDEAVVLLDDGKLVSKNISHQLPIKLTPRTRQRVPSWGMPFTPGPPLPNADNPWLNRSGSALFSEAQSSTIVAYGIPCDEDEAMALAIAESIRTAKEEQTRNVNRQSIYTNETYSSPALKYEEKSYMRAPPDPPGTSWESEEDWKKPISVTSKDQQLHSDRVTVMKIPSERKNVDANVGVAKTEMEHDFEMKKDVNFTSPSKLMTEKDQRAKYSDQRQDFSNKHRGRTFSEGSEDALSCNMYANEIEVGEKRTKSPAVKVSSSNQIKPEENYYDSNSTQKYLEEVSQITQSYCSPSTESTPSNDFDKQDSVHKSPVVLPEKNPSYRANRVPKLSSPKQDSRKHVLEKNELQGTSFNANKTQGDNLWEEDNNTRSVEVESDSSVSSKRSLEEARSSISSKRSPEEAPRRVLQRTRLPTSMPALISAMNSFTQSSSPLDKKTADSVVSPNKEHVKVQAKDKADSEASEKDQGESSCSTSLLEPKRPADEEEQIPKTSVGGNDAGSTQIETVGSPWPMPQIPVQPQQQMPLLNHHLPQIIPNGSPELPQDVKSALAAGQLQNFQMLAMQQALLGLAPPDLQNIQNLNGAGSVPSQLPRADQPSQDQANIQNYLGAGFPGLQNALTAGLTGPLLSTYTNLLGNQSTLAAAGFPGPGFPTAVREGLSGLQNPMQGLPLGGLPGFPGLPPTLPGLFPGLPGTFPGLFSGLPTIPNDLSGLQNIVPNGLQNATLPNSLPGCPNPFLAGPPSVQQSLFPPNTVPSSMSAHLQGNAPLISPGSLHFNNGVSSGCNLPQPGQLPLFSGKGRGRLNRGTPTA